MGHEQIPLMPARLSARQRINEKMQCIVSLLLLAVLLASCTYTRTVYELHARSPGAPLSSKDMRLACSIIDQIAAQERLQPVPPNNTAMIRLYCQKVPPILASGGEACLGLSRTPDNNMLSFGAWLTAPGSTFASRRLERRVFERFESKFGSNRVSKKTDAYPMPIGF